MTRLQFLLQQREWCNKWMDTPADQLPGVLTHDKVARVAIDTEVNGSGVVFQEPLEAA